MTEAQLHRYARHISLGAIGFRGQKRLLSSTVIAEARGDAASHCAIVYMAASGVGRIALRGTGDAAGDTVSDEEVGRSLLFKADDVGRNRIEVLRQRISKINPDVEVVSTQEESSIEVPPADSLSSGLALGCAAAASLIAGIAGDTDQAEDTQ